MRSGISGARANQPSITTNRPSSASPATIRISGGADAPPGLVGAHDAEHQQREPDGGGQGAAQVEVARAGRRCGSPAGSAARDGGQQTDRDVDEQDPAPAEQVGEHAAQQHAGGAAGAAHRAPDADGAVARGALGERGGEDRQRRRGDDRAAESLDRAGGDQHALAVGDAAGQRGEREQDEPGHEDAAASEQVGGPAAEQQEAGEGDRVGVDDPLQVDLGEAEAVADRRQRDVDDGDVENDHELRQARQQQSRAQMRRPGVIGCLDVMSSFRCEVRRPSYIVERSR